MTKQRARAARKPQPQGEQETIGALTHIAISMARIADALELILKSVCLSANTSVAQLRAIPDEPYPPEPESALGHATVENPTPFDMQMADLEAKVRAYFQLPDEAPLPPIENWPSEEDLMETE